ncbi:MAG: SRPBCC family protein [bacterium]
MRKTACLWLSGLFIFAVSCCAAASSAGAAPAGAGGFSALTGDDLERVKAGEIVMKIGEDDRCYTARTFAMVDGDIETVWDVILDFDRFQDFMPNTIKSRAEWVDEGTAYYHGVIKVLLFKQNYVLKHTLENGKDRKTDRWEQADREKLFDDRSSVNLTVSEGRWTLERVGGRTFSDYFACVNISDRIPEFVRKRAINILINYSVPEIIKAARKRTEEIISGGSKKTKDSS